MAVATVTSKGQVTIPKGVRDRLGIHPGDQLEFTESERGFVVRKRVVASPFDKYVGFLRELEGRDPDELVEEMRAMISAVDSNILFDVLIPGAPHLELSRRALDDASRAGALILSDPAYAEPAAHFADSADLEQFIADTGLRLEPSGCQALALAGRAWRLYQRRRPKGLACPQCGHVQEVACGRCGKLITVRQHMVADFIVGAHASVHAGRLLTRDRGCYATYFPELVLYPT